jgi:hypothetical protein
MQVVAVMQERGERYRERMADVSEKVPDRLDSMDADEILLRSSQVEKSTPLHAALLGWMFRRLAAARLTYMSSVADVRLCRSTRRTNSNPLSRRDRSGRSKGMPLFSAGRTPADFS